MMDPTTLARNEKAPALVGTMPVSKLGSPDYRFAIEVAVASIASRGIPMVKCPSAQLSALLNQVLPSWTESGPAAGGLWIEPLSDTWKDDLAALWNGLQPGSPLRVIASRPLARLLPERAGWRSQPVGLGPLGITRLVSALRGAGFRIESRFGVHSLVSTGLNLSAGWLSRLGRPEAGDRLLSAARLRYCTGGPSGWLSTVMLLFAYRSK